MSTLFPGQSLKPGQTLQSDNRLHTLIMQFDGNAVLYNSAWTPQWATKTAGLQPREFIMQNDGNLVLYDTSNYPRWASMTEGNAGAFLNVQNDGNLVVYRAGSATETADNALWEAGTQMTQVSHIGLFFQGYEEHGGQLWWGNYDGANWTGQQIVPNVGLSCAPSPVVWNGRLHVFHQGAYENGELWFTYYDGTFWQPDERVQPVGMSFSPSAVVYRGQLYVFHQWGYQNGELWYKVYDGTSWQPDTKLLVGGGMSFSPAAVVWQDKLFVFFQDEGGGSPLGGTGGGGLFYMVYDGATWQPPDLGDGRFPFYQVPGVGISGSPSPVVWNGRLHVFHQGGYDSGELRFTYYDGTTWTADNPGSWSPDTRVENVIVPSVYDQQSISAVNFNSKLYVFHQDQPNQIACKIYDGTSWQPDTRVLSVPATLYIGCAAY